MKTWGVVARCLVVFFIAFVVPTVQAKTWTGSVGLLWSDPDNWDPAEVPGSDEYVTIPAESQVTVDTAAVCAGLELDPGASLYIASSGSLDLTSWSYWSYFRGTLVNDGVVSINASAAFYAPLVNAGVVSIGASVTLYAPLVNDGTVNWIGGGIYVYNDGGGNPGVVSNRVGGVWDIQCDGQSLSGLGWGYDRFVNEGTLCKSAGEGATYFSVVLLQSGTVDVQSGTLYVQAGGEIAGTVSAAPSAAIRFASGTFDVGVAAFSGDVQFTGGTVDIGNGLFTGDVGFLGGACRMDGDLAREIVIDGANLFVSGALTGTVSFLSGGLVPPGAALTVAPGGVVNISGSATLYGPLVNDGTVNWTDGDIGVYNDGGTYFGVISNRVGGVWDIQCSWQSVSGWGWGLDRFVNAGTLRKSAVAGDTYLSVAMLQSGTVDVQAGTLQVQAGGELVGTVDAASGAAIRFSGGTFDVGAAAFSGDVQFTGGTVDINTGLFTGDVGFLGGTCHMDGDLARAITIDGANMVVSGALTGTVSFLSGGLMPSGAALTIAPGGVVNIGGSTTLYGPLVNDGTVNWTAGNIGVYNDGGTYSGVISNRVGGAWDIQCDGHSVSGYGWGLERFVNAGTLRKSAGAGDSYIGIPLLQSGEVDVQSGTLHVQVGGELAGTVGAASGAAIRFSGGAFDVGAAAFSGDVQFTGGRVDIGAGLFTGDVGFLGGTCHMDGNLAREIVIDGANLFVSGALTGTVSFLSGGLVPSGAALTVASGGVVNIGGAATLYGPLVNEGTVSWTAGNISVYNDGGTYFGVISNRVGGVWDIQCDGQSVSGYGWGLERFVNVGMLRKSADAGNSFIGIPLLQSGGVDVQSGTLYMQAGGEITGTVDAASGAAIRFSGGTFDVGVAAFSGDIQFVGGVCRLGEEMTDEVTVNGAAFEGVLSGRLLVLSGSLRQGSALSVAEDAVLEIAGPTYLYGPLVNDGTVNWTDGGISVYDDGDTYSGVISNRVGGVWDIQCDGQSVSGNWGIERFVNEGTLCKSAGAGATYFSVVLLQVGTVDVQSGTLYLHAGGEIAGTVAAASGAAIRFTGGTFDVGAPAFSGDIRFTGGTADIGRGLYTGDVGFRGGTCQMDGDLAREITIDGASMVVSGALTGTVSFLSGGLLPPGAPLMIAPAGVVNIGGSASLYGPLVNDGTINWTGGSIGVYNDGGTYLGVISNRVGGVWDIQCDGQSLSWYWGFERFVNEGTLRKSTGAGNTFFYINFVNAGTVESRTGAIRLPYAPDLQGGMLRSMLADGASAGYTYVDGETVLDGRVGAFLADGFRPFAGDRFVLVRHNGLSGSFDGTDFPAGIAWETNLDSSAFAITALNNAPEIAPIEDQETDEQVPFSFSIPGYDWDIANPCVIGISIPTNSMDASCYPLNEDVWTVQAPPLPFNTASGIGYLVSPAPISLYALALHDHGYIDNYVPDPSRAVVTYEFEAPVTVAGIEVVQHGNGITEIEGFAGDSLGSLTSVGSVYSPAGQTTFTEGEISIFTFTAPAPGKYFRFIIRQTSLENGYAAYRAYPLKAGNARIAPAYAPQNALVYSLISGPTGASVDPDTGLFSWTPTEAQGPGLYEVEVVVGDSGSPELFVTNSFSVTVNEVNVAPLLAAIGNKNVNEGVALGFTAAATDADLPANTLTYSLVGAPSGASINPGTGVFAWTPTEAQGPGPYTFTVKVADNGSPVLSDEEEITVTVAEVNLAPVLTCPANTSIHVREMFAAAASATDADIPANTLSFALVSGPSGLTVGEGGAINWSPSEGDVGINEVRVRVTDNGSPALARTNSFSITVAPACKLEGLALQSNQAILSWNSISGRLYRVQACSNLLNDSWEDLPPPVTATGSRATVTNSTTNIRIRFYRILLGF